MCYNSLLIRFDQNFSIFHFKSFPFWEKIRKGFIFVFAKCKADELLNLRCIRLKDHEGKKICYGDFILLRF